MTGEIVWRPDPAAAEKTALAGFMREVGCRDFDDLLARSDADPEWYWDAVIRHFAIRFDRPYDRVRDLSAGVAWPKWLVGATMNITASLIDRHVEAGFGDRPALSGETEDGRRSEWSYDRLLAETCRLAAALREMGVGEGTAVGVFMPMCPEVVAAFCAIARLGAITVPLFSGFGPEAMATRLNDPEAIAVVTVDGSRRRGNPVPMKATLDAALEQVPTVRHVVVHRNTGADVTMRPGRDHWWDEATAGRPDRMAPVMVDAEAPLLLVYTSGTTGRPKGPVLTQCGVLVKATSDFQLNADWNRDDRILWLTDFGWVVGPLVAVASLAAGACMVVIEGGPDYPGHDRMWRLAADHRATWLGIAPTSVRTLMRHGPEAVARHDLSRLRGMLSTGEPWTEEAWLWLFEHVGRRRIPILNWSGGTEIGGGILCGTMIHAQKPCSFAGPCPAMGADILDEQGRSVGPGEVGELVLKTPSIGLARGLWKDPERYVETYFSMYPDIWRHGDWAMRDGDGMWYVLGRSDDTIKVSGKRTGPAEIEGMVMATGRVSEAAAIGVPDPVKGQAVMCVCVPAPGVAADDALAATVADAVSNGFGKSFRPSRILFVDDLPKTRSMKIMRRVVRALVLDEAPGDLSSLTNPEALEPLREAARRQA